VRRAVIEGFFKELDRALGRPADVILTGAAAGALWGNVRPSLDIDFEIRLKGEGKAEGRSLLEEAVQKACREAGIAANYSENIGHGSLIDFLDYRKAALPYKKIGRLKVRLMAPAHWTLGKMARFLEIDIRDLLKIIKRKRIAPVPLARLWGRALRQSSLSLATAQFRDHVIYFLNRHGKQAWGRSFNPAKALALFEKTAGIKGKF